MSDEPMNLSGKTFMVVDDDPGILEMVTEMIYMFQAKCIGLSRLDPFTAHLRGVDAVLIDLMLTEKWSGIELASNLKKQGYTGCLIALSASDMMLNLAKKERDLFCGYIAKPFDLMDMYRVLESI